MGAGVFLDRHGKEPQVAVYALPANHNGVSASHPEREGAGASASACRSADSCARPFDLSSS
jgi:hypothetical protein